MRWLCLFLSLLRIPLAAALLVPSPAVQVSAIVGAMTTDVLDGYLARTFNATSLLGKIVDPLTDKFFALFAIGIFYTSGQMSILESIAFLSRDIFLIAFTCFLFATGSWGKYTIRSLTWGKVSTSFQLIVLILLAAQWKIPSLTYSIFVAFGALSFRDFYNHLQSAPIKS